MKIKPLMSVCLIVCITQCCAFNHARYLPAVNCLEGRNYSERVKRQTSCGADVCNNNGTCTVYEEEYYFCDCTEKYEGQHCDETPRKKPHRMKMSALPPILYDKNFIVGKVNFFIVVVAETGDSFEGALSLRSGVVIKWDDTAFIQTDLTLAAYLDKECYAPTNVPTPAYTHISRTAFCPYFRSLNQQAVRAAGSNYKMFIVSEVFNKAQDNKLLCALSNVALYQFKANFTLMVTLGEENDCLPDVDIRDCERSNQINQQTEWHREDHKYIRSVGVRTCSGGTVKRRWQLFRLGKDAFDPVATYPVYYTMPGSKYSTNTLDSFERLGVAYDLAPFSLPYGLYNLHFLMSAYPDEVRKRYNRASCFFKIEPLPLVARIVGGVMRWMGSGDEVEIDASPSYDPNQHPENQHLSYRWSCVFPYKLYFQGGMLVNENKTDPNCKGAQYPLGYDKIFVPKFEIQRKTYYQFVLNIASAGMKATVNQTYHMEEQPIRRLVILCVLNCGPDVESNPDEVIYLRAVCTANCGPGDPTYDWASDQATYKPMLKGQGTVFGNSSTDRLVINPDTLYEGLDYEWFVFYIVPGMRSTASYHLRTNGRPWAKKSPPCTLNSTATNGRPTIDDRFTILCDGFTDNDTRGMLRFHFYQSNGKDDAGILVVYDSAAFPFELRRDAVRLTEGDPDAGYATTLKVRVSDKHDMATEWTFPELHVYSARPWSMQRVAAMYSGQADPRSPTLDAELSLDASLVSGDTSRAVRLVSALADAATRIEDADVAALNTFKSDLKHIFVTDLGRIPLETPSALDQVSGVLRKVLLQDKAPIQHATAAAAADLLRRLSERLWGRAEASRELGNVKLPPAEALQIATAILQSMPTLIVGTSEVPKDENIVSTPTSQQEKDYPLYEDSLLDSVLQVIDYNHACKHYIDVVWELGSSLAYQLGEALEPTVITTEDLVMWAVVDKPTHLAGRLLGGQPQPPQARRAAQGHTHTCCKLSRRLAKALEKLSPNIDLKVTVSKRNLFWYKHHVRDINTEFVFVAMETYHPNYTRTKLGPKKSVPLPDAIDVYLKVDATSEVAATVGRVSVNMSNLGEIDYQIDVYKIDMDEGSILYLQFVEEGTPDRLQVVVTQDVRPSKTDFERAYSIPGEEGGGERFVIKHPTRADSDDVWFYVGILPHPDDIARGAGTVNASYEFRVSKVKCCHWDAAGNKWSTRGCTVGSETALPLLHCRCNHLSLFSGAYAAQPIDADVFKGVDISLQLMHNNEVVAGVVAAVLVATTLGLIWARRKDRRDEGQRGVTVLDNSHPEHHYAYMITVFTGRHWDAGTSANIGIQLIGKGGEGDPQVLTDASRRVLHRGTDCWFLLCARGSLGALTSLRMWSDASGRHPAWHCDKVVVSEMATGDKYTFLVRRWLSVSHGDNTLTCAVPVASVDQLASRGGLFVENLMLGFREDHLWLSVLLRHPRSRYTRSARLAVAVCMLVIAMLLQVELHGVPNQEPASQLEPGRYSFAVNEFLIALQSASMAYPFAFVVMLLFRKSEPFDAKRQRKQADTATAKDAVENPVLATRGTPAGGTDGDAETTVHRAKTYSRFSRWVINVILMDPLIPAEQSLIDEQNSHAEECNCRVPCTCLYYEPVSHLDTCQIRAQASNWQAPHHSLFPAGPSYWFPPWVTYLAWFLCTFTISLCAYFLITYGLVFDLVRSSLWLTSVAWVVICSVLIFEPLRVCINSLIISYVYRLSAKTVYYPYDICGRHKSKMVGYVNFPGRRRTRHRGSLLRPLRPAQHSWLREQILNREKFGDMFLDVGLFVLYYVTLYAAVWGNRDSHAYASTQNLRNMLTDGSFVGGPAFEEVSTVTQLVEYLNVTYLGGLHAAETYSGDVVDEAGLMTDMSTRLLGVPQLRQLRVRDNSCRVHPAFASTIKECLAAFDLTTSDTRDYAAGWTELDADAEDVPLKIRAPWLYQTTMATGSFPLTLEMGYYPGSGYVATLGRTLQNSRAVLDTLVQLGWLDRNTRALFLDFTTYSTNQNLFNVVTLVAEISPGGVINLVEKIKTVKLLIDLSSASYQSLALLFCSLVLAAHVCRHVSRCTTWRGYLGDAWHLCDLLIVALCVTCVALYSERSVYVANLLRRLQAAENNEHVSFLAAAYSDTVFGYMVAVLVAVSTARIWKLFRLFGDKFLIVELTLWSAASTLFSLALAVAILMNMFVTVARLLMGTVVEPFRDYFHTLTTLLSFSLDFRLISEQLDMHAIWLWTPLLGPIFFAIYILAMAIYMTNLFVTIIVIYYKVSHARVHKEREAAGPVTYLKGELRYYLGMRSQRVERLRGGEDILPASRVAVSKAPVIRNANSITGRRSTFTAMRLLTIDALRRFFFRGAADRERRERQAEERRLNEERMSAMLIMSVDMMKEEDDETNEEVFFKAMKNERLAMVQDTRLHNMERTLNGFGRNRQGERIADVVAARDASGIEEELAIMNANLRRLEALLRRGKSPRRASVKDREQPPVVLPADLTDKPKPATSVEKIPLLPDKSKPDSSAEVEISEKPPVELPADLTDKPKPATSVEKTPSLPKPPEDLPADLTDKPKPVTSVEKTLSVPKPSVDLPADLTDKPKPATSVEKTPSLPDESKWYNAAESERPPIQQTPEKDEQKSQEDLPSGITEIHKPVTTVVSSPRLLDQSIRDNSIKSHRPQIKHIPELPAMANYCGLFTISDNQPYASWSHSSGHVIEIPPPGMTPRLYPVPRLPNYCSIYSTSYTPNSVVEIRSCLSSFTINPFGCSDIEYLSSIPKAIESCRALTLPPPSQTRNAENKGVPNPSCHSSRRDMGTTAEIFLLSHSRPDKSFLELAEFFDPTSHADTGKIQDNLRPSVPSDGLPRPYRNSSEGNAFPLSSEEEAVDANKQTKVGKSRRQRGIRDRDKEDSDESRHAHLGALQKNRGNKNYSSQLGGEGVDRETSFPEGDSSEDRKDLGKRRSNKRRPKGVEFSAEDQHRSQQRRQRKYEVDYSFGPPRYVGSRSTEEESSSCEEIQNQINNIEGIDFILRFYNNSKVRFRGSRAAIKQPSAQANSELLGRSSSNSSRASLGADDVTSWRREAGKNLKRTDKLVDVAELTRKSSRPSKDAKQRRVRGAQNEGSLCSLDGGERAMLFGRREGEEQPSCRRETREDTLSLSGKEKEHQARRDSLTRQGAVKKRPKNLSDAESSDE